MHKNTYLLVSILAVLAALVIGVNIGKQFNPPSSIPTLTLTPTAELNFQAIASASAQPTTAMLTYMDTPCKFSIQYDPTYTVADDASGSAVFTSQTDSTDKITMTCQSFIPTPALPANQIQTIAVTGPTGASVSAKLYRDTSAKDGTPIEAVIFRHPVTGMDIFISGYGASYEKSIKTISLTR